MLSQSGESSETVWNIENFSEIISIVNYGDSTLATAPNVKKVVDIYAGEEENSSTKTYINTLIALYIGLGYDPEKGVRRIVDTFRELEDEAKKIANDVDNYMQSTSVKGFYIIGSGPNIGTAYEGALTFGETTKLPWIGMSVAQYDHGPKETAEDTIVLALNSSGKDAKRIVSVKKVLKKGSNALFVEIKEDSLEEVFSPLTLMVKFNLIMNYLAERMDVGETFVLGGKVTTVGDDVK